MSGYRPEFFQLHELVPKDVYQDYPEHILWSVFDPYILMTADGLRRRYGKMVANTWYWGGLNQFRGWRPPWCSIGAPLSMHRFGRAIDLDPVEVTAEEIRDDMRRLPDIILAFKYITRVEDKVSWLHVDRANVISDEIVFFNP